MVSDFHSIIIMAKHSHKSDIITISIQNLTQKNAISQIHL